MQSAMRASLGFIFFICLISCANFVFAQHGSFKEKQDSLKTADNLTYWIYERLDYVSQHPKHISLINLIAKVIWRKPKSDLEKQAWLDYLNTQGYYKLQEGNILDAIDSYESAFSYFQQNKKSLKEYEIIEYTLKPLSNNYTRLGDYERALYLQKKSIDILTASNKKEALSSILGNMAISYRSMGNFQQAESTILNAIRNAPPNYLVDMLLYNIYADVLFNQNKLLEAKNLIEKNITKHSKLTRDNIQSTISAYSISGDIHLALGNLTLADKQLNYALNILNKYFKGLKIRDRANILTQLGKVKLEQHEPLLALNYLQAALKSLKIIDDKNLVDEREIYGENKLMEVFEQLAIVCNTLNKPNEAFKNIQLALLTADKIRNEFADDKTKQRLQADTKNIAERGIEICYHQYLKTKQEKYLINILHLSEQSKSRTLLDQIQRNQKMLATHNKDSLFVKKLILERAIVFNERQRIEQNNNNNNNETLKFDLALINKQIKEKYKQFEISGYENSIYQENKKLPQNRIISYFFGEKAIYILNIKDSKIIQVEKLADASMIKSLIENFSNTYFQHGPNAMMNDPKLFFSKSNEIYKTVLPNISFIPNEKIIIIPDGILSFISFDGLIKSDRYIANISKWPFVIKNNTISYAFSIQTLLSNKISANNHRFTGLFITHQKQNTKPLLLVQKEADRINKIISGNFLFNSSVNSKSFLKAFEESKVLHIGTHAYLSGKDNEPTLDFEKEKIYLFELSAKKTAPALVFLSACRTADGELADGEGVISLSRGFSAIGTPATIASLWNINDDAASTITANFYKHLITKKSASEALNLAKKDWLNNQQSIDAMYLPYYWDSLIYMGADQDINLSQATNWWLGLKIALSISLLSILIIIMRKKLKLQASI